MKKTIITFFSLCTIILLGSVWFFRTPIIPPSGTSDENGTPLQTTQISPQKSVHFPIDNALDRVTKKTFGLKVSPTNSPVSPEKFAGYHTGVDFETFPSEQETDIAIRPICTGPLVLKKWASGYGGVVVQRCQIMEQEATVIYGHLKIESVEATAGSTIKPDQPLGILGKGFSIETDGERKHLHLGIHRGTAVTLRGYVSTVSELDFWIDPMSYLNPKK